MPPRKTTLTSLSLVLLATAANAWDFIIYGDSECEMTPMAQFSESGNKGYVLPFSRRHFREHDG